MEEGAWSRQMPEKAKKQKHSSQSKNEHLASRRQSSSIPVKVGNKIGMTTVIQLWETPATELEIEHRNIDKKIEVNNGKEGVNYYLLLIWLYNWLSKRIT